MSWDYVLGGIGAIVGGIYGGWQGAMAGWSIGSTLGGYIEGPEQLALSQEGFRLEDLSTMQSTSAFGNPIVHVYGRGRVNGQLIWSSGLKETIHTDVTTVTAGKGGSNQSTDVTTTTTTYTYSADFAMLLCKGEIVGIRKIWADGQIIYNVSDTADNDTIALSLRLKDSLTIYTGTETQNPNSLMQSYEGIEYTPAYRGLAYVVFTNLQLADYGNRIPQLSFEVVTSGSVVGDILFPTNVALSDIIEDMITSRTKLTAADIDVSLLSDELAGFKVNDAVSVKDSLMQILTAYSIDGVESGGKLKFIKRGSDVIAEIPEDDLCAYENQEADESLDLMITRRIRESELPKKVSVSYFDVDRKYEVGEQHVDRRNVTTVKEVAYKLPVNFTADQAIQLAERMLYTSWISRDTYEIRLSFKYLRLEPSDVITFTVNDVEYTMRILYMEIGYPGLLLLRGVADDTNSYISTASGITPVDISENIKGMSDTVANFLDIPMLQDTHDDPGFYLAVCGETTSWNGCIVYRSLDNGITYNSIAYLNAAATMGVSLDALGISDGYTWDDHNTVDVELYHGELESKSEELVLNGHNTGLLGDEVIRWKNATLIDTNTYRLSGLLRGCFGTEYAINNHAIGDRFIYLVNGTYTRMTGGLNQIGLPIYYKVVSLGNLIELTDAVVFTNAARGLRPLSPVHVKGVRDSEGNLTISWIRRTRFGGDWRDNVDVPLNEETEQYYVEINDISYSVLYRTILATSPSCVYTAAQQTEDFGSIQDEISITVYQYSTRVGMGFTTYASV